MQHQPTKEGDTMIVLTRKQCELLEAYVMGSNADAEQYDRVLNHSIPWRDRLRYRLRRWLNSNA